MPDKLVGKKVSVRLYSEKISVFHDGKKVAYHERSYRQGAWSLKLEHYLNTFLRKPWALKGSVALKQAEKQIRSLFEAYFSDNLVICDEFGYVSCDKEGREYDREVI